MSDRQDLFSDLDKAFIRSHPLGRLATITSDGSPTVVPVTAEPACGPHAGRDWIPGHSVGEVA